MQVGSMNFNLHKLAADIFSFCFTFGIELDIEWVPRSLNEKSDYLSKIVDYDDWELAPEFFRQLDELWDPFTVDCFATHYNRKVPKYFSRFWNPGTAGVDAFFQNWEHENCLVVPPVVFLSKVLVFMFRCNARGTSVVPYWPSSPFWPLLVHKFWNFVVDYSFFESRIALRQGLNTNLLRLLRVSYDKVISIYEPGVIEFGLLDKCNLNRLAVSTYWKPVGCFLCCL